MDRKEVSAGYLRAVQRSGVRPNFWMGDDFLTLCEWEWRSVGSLEGFFDEEFGGWLLPPMRDGKLVVYGERVWAGLPVSEEKEEEEVGRWMEFLDYQFMYDPGNFRDLHGGKWSVFRKNIRKWPIRSAPHGWRYGSIVGMDGALTKLVEGWADRVGELYDPENLVRLALFGSRRSGLWRGGELVGLNVWDENYLYVNYRLCIDNGEPYLQEFLRYLFYSCDADDSRWVNDGGSLGIIGLEAFKFKLNPVAVWKVYSWL